MAVKNFLGLFIAFSSLLSVSAFVNGDITLSSNGTVSAPPGIHDKLIEALSKNTNLQAAINAYRARNFAECEKQIVLARDLGEKLPAIPIVMARIAMELGAVPDAIARIENYISDDSSDPMAYAFLGEIALRSGRWTDAWLQLEKCNELLSLKSSPENDELATRLLALRSETAARRKQWTVSDELLQKWAEKEPNAAAPIWSMGLLKLAQGELSGALEKFKAARAIDPKLPQPELTIAGDLANTDAGNSCEKWFVDGLKAQDAGLANWVAFTRWLLMKDRSSDIEKLIAKAKPEFQNSRDLKFIRGVSARMSGKTAEAEAIFSELHQANADDLEAADQLALVLVESTDEGKRARAQQLSEATLRRAPNVENAVATAAWVQYKLGSIDVADRILAELASKVALSPQSAYYVGQLLRARGRDSDGLLVLEAAVKSPGIFVQRKAVEAELAKAAAKTGESK